MWVKLLCILSGSLRLVDDHSSSAVSANSRLSLRSSRKEIQRRGRSFSSVWQPVLKARLADVLLDLDDELDLVNVQNDLRESLLSSPIESQATLLEGRLSLRQLFSEQAQQLVNGAALDIEGLVDVLTLKDNGGASSRDAATALDRLVKDTVSLSS